MLKVGKNIYLSELNVRSKTFKRHKTFLRVCIASPHVSTFLTLKLMPHV